MSRTTPVTLLGLAVLASACFTTQRVARPSEPLVVEAGRFPHEVLDGVLRKVVDGKGRVDYKALAADRGPLERYLWAVSEHSPRSHPELFPSEADKLAYWINAYNAWVLYAVTERPTMRSVNDDKTDFFYFTEYTLGGASMSLYALENDVVREEHAEPRIHFALNCASAGCPELPAEAFLPASLEAQLAREATEFCAHPDKVRAAAGVVEMSSIFDWYAEDFVGSGGPVAFCRKWGNTTLPADAKPAFLPYDWALNAQPGKALFE